MRKFTLVVAAAACAVSLAACSSSEEKAQEATQENNAALCASLEALQSQVDEVTTGASQAAASGDQVTVEQAQESLQALGAAFQKVAEDRKELSASVQEQFNLAQQQYVDELSSIDGDTPLSEAGTEVQQAQENLSTQYEQILSEVGCK